jgi:hypothetical protein
MQLKITINMDNGAFGLDQFDRLSEVSAVLQRFTDAAFGDLEVGNSHNLRDSNGNSVGMAEVVE